MVLKHIYIGRLQEKDKTYVDAIHTINYHYKEIELQKVFTF